MPAPAAMLRHNAGQGRMTCHKGKLLPHEEGPVAVNVVFQPLTLSNKFLPYFLLLLLVLSARITTSSAQMHVTETTSSKSHKGVCPGTNSTVFKPLCQNWKSRCALCSGTFVHDWPSRTKSAASRFVYEQACCWSQLSNVSGLTWRGLG